MYNTIYTYLEYMNDITDISVKNVLSNVLDDVHMYMFLCRFVSSGQLYL